MKFMLTLKHGSIITALTALAIVLPGGPQASGADGPANRGTNYQGALELIDRATGSGNRQADAKTEYDFDAYLIPVWTGSTAHDETVLMLKGNGLPEASLLYVPERILSVKSPDLKTEYQAGKDYVVEGRKIILTAGSRAVCLTTGDMYPSQASKQTSVRRGGGNLTLSLADGRHFCEVQLRVTYTHKETGFGGYTPPTFGDKLIPKTIARLQKGEALKIVKGSVPANGENGLT